MLLVCFISGKVAIQKEDLQKYHNRDTWFQLQHVDADSEVQVRWLQILLCLFFCQGHGSFMSFIALGQMCCFPAKKEALPISTVWVLVISVRWIPSVHTSLRVRIVPTEIIETM